MTVTKLLDTSIWFAFFCDESQEITKIIESEETLYSSVLSLYELKKKLIQNGKHEQAERAINVMKKRAIILPITEFVAERAAVIAVKYNLSMADAIIYTSAEGGILITSDHDFAKLKGVTIIKTA